MGNSKKKKKSKKDNASWKLERMVEREVKKRLSGSRKKTKSRPKLKLRPISDTSSQSTDDDNSGSSGSSDSSSSITSSSSMDNKKKKKHYRSSFLSKKDASKNRKPRGKVYDNINESESQSQSQDEETAEPEDNSLETTRSVTSDFTVTTVSSPHPEAPSGSSNRPTLTTGPMSGHKRTIREHWSHQVKTKKPCPERNKFLNDQTEFCIMLQYKGQTFPFVVLPTYNFENFKIGIEKTLQTDLISGKMLMCYETEINGKLIQVSINSSMTYEAFIEVLRTFDKPMLLKISDVSASLYNSNSVSNSSTSATFDSSFATSTTSVETITSECNAANETIEFPKPDSSGKEVLQWLEKVVWKSTYVSKLKSLSGNKGLRMRERAIREIVAW